LQTDGAQAADPSLNRIKREERIRKFPEDDIRNHLEGISSANIVFPLADSVQELFHNDSSIQSLADALHNLINRSPVIWKPKFSCHKIVLSISPNICVKIITDVADTTEYSTLRYLQTHLPDIPAPKPLGLVTFGERFSLLFMTLMSGSTLEAIWPTLNHVQKTYVQEQLNGIFTSLRSHRPSSKERTLLGGTAGEGCKDLRRHVRSTTEPIYTASQFDDWQFSNPHFGSAIYITALRKLSPPLEEHVVLSHNDLRPDNITAELKDGDVRVTGIIDWQYSGFYPVWYESTKVMNGMEPNERNDWYEFIPECISPERYPWKFLLDLVWWKFVE
jgi:hypothetical protein